MDPDAADRCWRGAADEAPLRAVVERFFPDAAGPLLRGGVCMFANTPDGHFVVDVHPRHPQARWGGASGLLQVRLAAKGFGFGL
jgi:sarcosine oxidase